MIREGEINKGKVFMMLAVILVLGLVMLDSSFQSLFITEDKPVQLPLESTQLATAELLKLNSCNECHEVERASKGPSYLSISRKYRDDTKALDQLITKVISSQIFVDHFEKSPDKNSQMYLLNSKPIPLTDIEKIVRWILSLRVG